jgi:hypothetical protein
VEDFMTQQRMAWMAAAVAIAGLVLAVGLQGQAQGTAGSAPRTPWGEPDLQGIWDSKIITPMERPDKYADREFLTDEEVAGLESAAAETPVGKGRDVRADAGTEEDVEGAYNNIFSTGQGTRYVRSKRTSLVIDPPNGKRPAITEEGKKLRAGRAVNRFGTPGELGDIPVAREPERTGPRSKKAVPYTVDIGRSNDNPEDRNDLERCRGVMLPCVGGLCGFSRIVQSPSAVTIYYEMGHSGGAYRTIPITSRPHHPPNVRLWLGDAIGKWEGDTLVVDTTNFTDLTAYQGVTDEKMHLIERFTRTANDDLKYQITIDKPNLYERPWTMELILMRADDKKNQIFESACYEGNYSLTGMLAGARLAEKEGRTGRR